MKIIQLLENIAYGDGMGNHAILTHQILKQAGYQVETYAANINNNVPNGIAKSFWKSFAIKPEDILLVHFGMSGTVMDQVEGIACRKIMIYQNITPPDFFKGYDEQAYIGTTEGYQLLKKWIRDQVFDAILTVSPYNCKDLVKMGYPKEFIGQLNGCLVPLWDYQETPDPETLKSFKDGNTNILFVGRMVPNKKHQDIVKAFAYYQKNLDSTARLIFIGGGRDEDYGLALKGYIEEQKIKNVIIPGHISFSSLIAFYQCADIFVCMSEHEGFCIPLVEAMLFDVPVLAYDAAAVPDTLGDAGVLLKKKDPAYIAKWIHKIVSDSELQEKILQEQRKRLGYFDQKVIGRQMIDFLEKFIEENIRKYQDIDDKGIHERGVGELIDDTLYQICSKKFAGVGMSMPISQGKYMARIKSYGVRK